MLMCGGAHFAVINARFDPGFAASSEMLELAAI
jgi:hypothetical protein